MQSCSNVSQIMSKKRQKGASMPSVLVFLAMAALCFLVGFKLYPVFFENWQLQSVIKGFEDDSEIGELSVNEINKRFQVRMQTNNIRDIKFDDSIIIEKDDGVVAIYVEYEARVNVYKNIDAVVVFNDETEIFY